MVVQLHLFPLKLRSCSCGRQAYLIKYFCLSLHTTNNQSRHTTLHYTTQERFAAKPDEERLVELDTLRQYLEEAKVGG